jgi:hypothetical protein
MNRFGTGIAGSQPSAQARGRFVALRLAPMVAISVLVSVAAPAAAQDISDKTVSAFMNYAWGLTPARFTKPDGKIVDIDKNDRPKAEVAIDVAREVIRAARLTAHAQMCELPLEQVQNYQSLMRREDAKKKWSEQQMIYINQLHLATVMMLTGKIVLVDQEEGKPAEVVVKENKPGDDGMNYKKSCTDEQRTKVKELISAYVKAGPELPKSADASASPLATGTVPVAATAPATKP